MDLPEKSGGRNRLVSGLLTGVLAVLSLRSLQKGRRLRGVLAGVGALLFGSLATAGGNSESERREVVTDIETESDEDQAGGTASESPTDETSTELTCAACGEAIRLGQRRGPNDEDKIVHETCK